MKRILFVLCSAVLCLLLNPAIATAEGAQLPATSISVASPAGISALKAGDALQLAEAAVYFFQGAGISGDPFIIGSKDDLVKLAELVNAGDAAYNQSYYSMQNDIDLSSISNWTSIGVIQSKAFGGVFDGNGFSILNVKQNNLASDVAVGGLFGYLSGATVQNLTLQDCSISAHILSATSTNPVSAGAVAGYMDNGSSIINCRVSGSVGAQTNATHTSSAAYTGGIVGYVDHGDTISRCSVEANTQIQSNASGGNSYAGGISAYVNSINSIDHCTNEGSVTSDTSSGDGYCGGIVARLSDGAIRDCSNAGELFASNSSFTLTVGGIVGYADAGELIRCYNTGSIRSADHAGGIAGFVRNTSVTACYNTGRVWSESNNAGGIVGVLSPGTIADCYNTGRVAAKSCAGGIAGEVSASSTISKCYSIGALHLEGDAIAAGDIAGKLFGTLSNCYFTDRIFAGVGSGTNTATEITLRQLLSQSTFAGFDFGSIWTMGGNPDYPYPELATLPYVGNTRNNTTDFAAGNGLPTSPYQIKTKQHLDNVRKYPDSYFELKNDITFAATDFTPGGVFYHDAKGFLPIGTTYQPFLGVFDGSGFAIKGLVQNFTHEWYAQGGLFGYVDCGVIKNLQLLDCSIKATVTSETIAGHASGAGIAGYIYNGRISRCGVTGSIQASAVISYLSFAGGIAGDAYASSITECYNTSSVSGYYAGGIVGYAAKNCVIRDSYNTGNASSQGSGAIVENAAGGIVGRADNNSSVSNCYSVGDVSSTSGSAGGVGGWVDRSIIDNCYYLDNTAQGIGGQTDTDRTKKMTGAQLRSQSTFSGFDFGGVWTMGGIVSYPYPELEGNPHITVVSFNSQTGSTVAPKTTRYNTTITAPSAPTRTGYTFGGWYRQAACTTAWNFTTDKVTANTTLYARWDPIKYAITATASNTTYGSVSGGGSIAYGTSVTVTATPKTGYRFVRWLEGSTAVSTSASYTFTVTKARTLKAEFTPISYAITVYANSTSYGTASGGGNYNHGSTATVRATPKTGCYFVRWLEGNITVSTSATYTFTVAKARTLKAEFTQIGTPTAKATAATYNSVKLTWTATAGAGGYEVWRSTSPSSGYTLAATVAGTTSTNTGLATGTTYYYKVRAYRTVNGVKVYGPYSSAVSAKPSLTAATGLKATAATYNSVKLTWTATAGAGGYEAWRSTKAASGYTLAATVAGTTITNPGLATGTTYYYKVRAYRTVNGVKVYGAYSWVVSAKPSLTTPTGVKAARASASSIKVSWVAVAGAMKYEVWRATSSGGTYYKLPDTSTPSYTNTGLTTGKTYYYKVRAYRMVNGVKVYGGYSAVVFARP